MFLTRPALMATNGLAFSTKFFMIFQNAQIIYSFDIWFLISLYFPIKNVLQLSHFYYNLEPKWTLTTFTDIKIKSRFSSSTSAICLFGYSFLFIQVDEPFLAELFSRWASIKYVTIIRLYYKETLSALVGFWDFNQMMAALKK